MWAELFINSKLAAALNITFGQNPAQRFDGSQQKCADIKVLALYINYLRSQIHKP
jgi:hypothetical protein